MEDLTIILVAVALLAVIVMTPNGSCNCITDDDTTGTGGVLSA